MLNKVILMGRFTKDPELRSTPQGVSTVSFTIACDRNFQKAGTEKQADFIGCVAWRQTAEFISKYFKKGSMIAVEGSIQTRNWDDNEGKRHYVTEVVVDRAHFAESKRDSASGGSPYGDAMPNYGGSQEPSYGDLPTPVAPIATEDDLPF
ncbi:MAG: single-stranded DNA-binding protein [Clostridia bacterium]|nr:single-stranded DNA-binding protein [Clostridia bacterium]